jgi:capsular polysaccharide biosynthesis protein
VELRAYLAIIWRRLWVVLLVVGVVALYVGYQYYHLRKIPGALTQYQSDVTLLISVPTSAKTGTPDGATNLMVSESLADDIVTGSPIFTLPEFDTAISQQISADMPQIEQRFGPNPDLGNWQDRGAIGGALSGVRTHSLVTISATWTTPAGAWAIGNAVGEVLTTSIGTYLDNNLTQPIVSARVISNATQAVAIPGFDASKQTLYLIMLLVALIIGIALAFLADYLDDRIRNEGEAATLLSLPIYGEVPRPPALGRGRSRP